MQAPVPATSSRFGVFELDASGELRKAGVRVHIQEQPLLVLRALLARPGAVVSREELRQLLWPDGTHVDAERSLTKALVKLRDALGDDADSPRFIETLPRHGYRFLPTPSAEAAIGAVPATPRETSAAPPRRFPGWWAAALGVAVVGVGLAFFSVGFRRQWAYGPPLTSLAVLPLENLSGDPSQDYFSDGLTDELITQLAQLPSVRVISRTSVMRFKQTRVPLSDIVRELNVDAVVEGTVVRDGSKVRVSVQLIEAREDRHLWAQSFQREAREIVALQSELAGVIAQHVSGHLPPGTPGHNLPDADAFDFYLRGRQAWSARTPEGLRKAMQFFDSAIERESTFAAAYSGRADATLVLAWQGGLPRETAYAAARADAKHAMTLDPQSAEAHASMGLVLRIVDWNFRGAEAELRRAVALSPSYSLAYHLLAQSLLAQGRAEEAVVEARKSVELDPLAFVVHNTYGFALQTVGRYEEAVSEYRASLRLEPHNSAHFSLGGVLWQMKRYQEALVEYGSLEDSRAAAWAETYQKVLAADGPEAAQKARLSDYLHTELASAHPFEVACLFAGLGQREEAFAWLERAISSRDVDTVFFKAYHCFDGLRSGPQHAMLLAQLGLHEE